ncbi:MAG: HAMP domain-containing histidine kinase [Clostridia bacterium]|nr:HAMP domain-containing histidine kinase [Clostridia bacterium]
MKKPTLKSVLSSLNSFLLFFFTVGFIVSCCMMLFLSILANTMELTLTSDNIAIAAKVTFWNVILISFLFKFADYIRRKIMVDRPTKVITESTKKIMSGDFSVRIKPMQSSGMEGFNRIAMAINKMAEELGSVETLRSDFIANVSHEMKTPLAVMQNYGTLLQDKSITESERIEYAKGITDVSRRMAEMITNILKLNRLENQQIFPKHDSFDLGEQLCDCLLRFEDVWEKAGIEIETDIAEGLTVNTDAELLSLVWSNLFSNAFKFTESGGSVFVSLTDDGDHATVTVRDSGCGMAPETGKHIFEKFYQGDTSHSSRGNGLGLALVKRVIDITQGEITVESELGKGSEFTVRVPK